MQLTVQDFPGQLFGRFVPFYRIAVGSADFSQPAVLSWIPSIHGKPPACVHGALPELTGGGSRVHRREGLGGVSSPPKIDSPQALQCTSGVLQA